MDNPILLIPERKSERCKRGILFLAAAVALLTAVIYSFLFGPLIGISGAIVLAFTYYLANSLVKERSIDKGVSEHYTWSMSVMTFGVTMPLLVFALSVGAMAANFHLTLALAVVALVYGTIYGTSIGAAIVYFHYRALENKVKPNYVERLMALHQVDAFKIDREFEDAYAYCKSRIDSTNRHKVVKENKPLGVLSVKSGIFLGYRDSNLTIFLSPEKTGKTRIVISSRPSVDNNVVDDGCNILNVRELKEALLGDSFNQNPPTLSC